MVDQKRTVTDKDAALEATVTNMAGSTEPNLESLVQNAASAVPETYAEESECQDFVKQIAELGAPQVSLREIGQYELLEQLGAGGMGEVWKARHKKLDRTVALKLLHPRISKSEGAAARFEQEMRAIGALQHENIVQALDAGEVDGVLYLTMEHVEGRVLSDVLTAVAKRGKPLSLAKACHVIRQAAAGLQFAHENGIVHRDIKPSNIMVTPKGGVKLLDMGLARLASSDSPMPELTAEGQIMGTLDYMPPEQLRDSRTADVPADIYALGATFYKLVTGRAPFADEKTNSLESKILAIASDKPVPVSELRKDVPPELSQLIDEMLRKEPAERPASANDVINRVNEVAAGLTQSKDESQATISVAPRSKPLPPPRDPPPTRFGKKHWLIGAGILGLLLFGGILLTLKDPVHGDLVIQGPAGVTIKATKIDDPSQFQTFTVGQDESSLTKGQWKITIVGEGFDELVIEDDVVKINGPEGAVVRISKRATGSTELDFAKWFFEEHMSKESTYKKLVVSSNGRKVTVGSLAELPSDFHITEVDLTASDLKTADYQRLSALTSLIRFTLRDGPLLSDDDLARLPTGSLTRLEFFDLDVSKAPRVFEQMSPCPKVTALYVSGDTRDCETILRSFEESRLEHLNIDRTDIDDNLGAAIARHRHVEQLRISQARTPRPLLRTLATMKSLSRLALDIAPEDEHALAGLADLPELADLNVTQTELTGSFLRAFAGHQSLRNLSLGTVTDKSETFRNLRTLPFLESLQMRGANLRDEDLEQFREFDQVLSLNIQSHGGTEKQLRALDGLANLSVNPNSWTRNIVPVANREAARFLEAGAVVECISDVDGRQWIPKRFIELGHNKGNRLIRVDVSGTALFLEDLTAISCPVDMLIVGDSQFAPADLKKLRSLPNIKALSVVAKSTKPADMPDAGIASSDSPMRSGKHVRDRLKKIDWTKGQAAASMQGYAVTPARIPGIPATWQVVPTLCHHVARDILLSPKGTYVVAVHDPGSDPYLRVNNRESGAIACCVQIGGSTGIQHYSFLPSDYVAFSPDETRFAVLLSWGRSVVRVYDMRGVLQAEWESKSEFGSTRWSPDGTRLMLTSGTQVEQRTPSGDIVETFAQPQGKTFGQVAWSPSGEKFAIVADGKILICNKNGGEPIATLAAPDGLRLHTCRWHPSEEKILTNGPRGSGAEASALLWALSGEHIRFDTKRLHEEFVGFSPDGQFLVTNYGDIRDQTNAVVSTVDMNWAGYIQAQNVKLRWQNPDRLVLASSQRGAGYSVEYTPSGKLLRRNENPVPLPQHSATFVDDKVRSIAGFLGSGSLHSNWTENSSSWLIPSGTREPTGFAAFSPSGSLAIQHTQADLPVHSSDGKLQYQLRGAHPFGLISWNHDGTLLAQGDIGAQNNRVLIWQEQQLIATLKGVHSREIRGLNWAPARNLLLVWDGDLNVCVWDPQKPEKPLVKTKGHGFKYNPSNNHWFFNTLSPRWSPDGNSIAVPNEDAVAIFSLADDKPTSRITWEPNQVGAIWWRQDSQRLLLGNRVVDLNGTVVGSIEGLGNRFLMEFDWTTDDSAIGTGHRFVAFWNKMTDKPKVISLPGFNYTSQPKIGMRSRGMNSQNKTSDRRFLLQQSGLSLTTPSSDRNGDIHLIDIKNQKHLWTGLAFTDGTQIKIAPTGQVLSEVENLERYLTYIVRYNDRRALTLTPAQFAARIGMSKGHQLVQKILDFGGSITIRGRWQPLTAADVPNSTHLPPIGDIVGIERTGNAHTVLSDLAGIENLASLHSLNLSGSQLSGDTLGAINQLKELKTLNLAGLEVSNGISAVLPKTLEELDLSETGVGDFLLFDLADFKSLKALRVIGTKVTEAGIAKLQDALPDCRITVR